MASGDPPRKSDVVALRDSRERAIAQLSDAFAHDLIGVDEFERRLTLLHRTDSVVEVERTIADLAPGEEAATAIVRASAPAHLANPEHVRDRQTIAAILGGTERTGAWAPARRIHVSAVMGGVQLDFREASLPPGVTEVHVTALMGGVQIIVPPTLSVDVSGTAIMGGFAHVERTPPREDADLPVLRVSGFALMGGVAVETRLPGETEIDSHRRRRRERRELRRQEHAALHAAPSPRRLPSKSE